MIYGHMFYSAGIKRLKCPTRSCTTSPAIWYHTVLPGTRHYRWMHPALAPARQDGIRFIYPWGMEGWVDLERVVHKWRHAQRGRRVHDIVTMCNVGVRGGWKVSWLHARHIWEKASASTLYRTPCYSTHGTTENDVSCRPTTDGVPTHGPRHRRLCSIPVANVSDHTKKIALCLKLINL